MQDPKDEQNKTEPEPAFSDPTDPRWSQNPYATPAQRPTQQPAQQPGQGTHPYADQPLYAPPGTPQNPYLKQPPYPGQGAGTPGQYPQQPFPQQQYPQPVYQPAAMEQSNVFGIISMVMGIIGLITFGAMMLPQIAAIICGHVSLRREKPRRGFALAGLIMGYLSLGIGLLMFLGLFALAAGGSTFS